MENAIKGRSRKDWSQIPMILLDCLMLSCYICRYPISIHSADGEQRCGVILRRKTPFQFQKRSMSTLDEVHTVGCLQKVINSLIHAFIQT